MNREWDDYTLEIKKELAKLQQEQIPTFIRKVALAVFQGVVNGSPVDRGQFRASWMPSINAPSEDIAPEIDRGERGPDPSPAGAAAYNEAMARFNQVISKESVTGNESIYISNNMPYAELLAEGSSQQAANGWIQNVLDEVDAAIESGRITI